MPQNKGAQEQAGGSHSEGEPKNPGGGPDGVASHSSSSRCMGRETQVNGPPSLPIPGWVLPFAEAKP